MVVIVILILSLTMNAVEKILTFIAYLSSCEVSDVLPRGKALFFFQIASSLYIFWIFIL